MHPADNVASSSQCNSEAMISTAENNFRHMPKFAMKSVRTTRHATMAHTRIFNQVHTNFQNERIEGKESRAQTNTSSTVLSSLVDQGTRFKWLHNTFTREGVLRKLLNDASTETSCHLVTKEDLDHILECCQGEGEGIFASKPKCQILGFRILHYLAEHQRGLFNAIDTMINECRKLNPQTLP